MSTGFSIMQPPALDHDAMMKERFNCDVRPEGRLERRVVFNLIAHLERAGFAVAGVHDGDEFTECADAKAAMELIFNLEEASLCMKNTSGKQHGILLILGNGLDIASDWNYSEGDPDGFDAAMDDFLDNVDQLA